MPKKHRLGRWTRPNLEAARDFIRDFGGNPYDEPSAVERLAALSDPEIAERVQQYEDGKSAEVKLFEEACRLIKAEVDKEIQRMERGNES